MAGIENLSQENLVAEEKDGDKKVMQGDWRDREGGRGGREGSGGREGGSCGRGQRWRQKVMPNVEEGRDRGRNFICVPTG